MSILSSFPSEIVKGEGNFQINGQIEETVILGNGISLEIGMLIRKLSNNVFEEITIKDVLGNYSFNNCIGFVKEVLSPNEAIIVWILYSKLNIVSDGLITDYDMNNLLNTDGLLVDTSGNDNHATLTGVTSNNYKQDGSLQFDGSQLVTTPINQNISNVNGFTTALIIKYNSRATSEGTIGDYASGSAGNNAFILFYWYSNLMYNGFYPDAYNYTINSSELPQNYSYLALTYNKNMMKMYINGVEKLSATIGNQNVTSGLIQLGRAQNAPGQWLKANVRKFSIYNRALTIDEVKQNYDKIVQKELV